MKNTYKRALKRLPESLLLPVVPVMIIYLLDGAEFSLITIYGLSVVIFNSLYFGASALIGLIKRT